MGWWVVCMSDSAWSASPTMPCPMFEAKSWDPLSSASTNIRAERCIALRCAALRLAPGRTVSGHEKNVLACLRLELFPRAARRSQESPTAEGYWAGAAVFAYIDCHRWTVRTRKGDNFRGNERGMDDLGQRAGGEGYQRNTARRFRHP